MVSFRGIEVHPARQTPLRNRTRYYQRDMEFRLVAARRLLYWQFRTLYGKFRKPADRRKIHKGEKNIERCKDVAHLDLFSRKGIKMRRIFPSFREKGIKMSHIFASFGEKESRCGISSFLFAQRRKDAADLYSFSHKETKMSHIFASFGEKERRYVRSSCLSATKDFLFGQRNKDTAHLCSFPPQGIRMSGILIPFGAKTETSGGS